MKNSRFKFRVWNGESLEELIIDFTIDKEVKYKEFYIYPDDIFMQFTGLKDKNGKEIYEGDICKVINYASDYLKIHGKMYCVISWSNTTGFYGKGFGVPTTFSIGEEFEVIGNIYENPELLEQK